MSTATAHAEPSALGKRHIEDGSKAKVGRWAGSALVIGALATIVACVDPAARQRFFYSALTGTSFYLSLTLGALFFVVLQHLVKAGWSVVVRRVAECLSLNLAWLIVPAVLLFLPAKLGLTDYHPWPAQLEHAGHGGHGEAAHGGGGAHGEAAGVEAEHGQAAAHGEVAAHGEAPAQGQAAEPAVVHHMSPLKASWLSWGYTVLRVVLYFVIWIVLARLYHGWSLAQDPSGDVALTNKMQWFSPIGMILFAITCCMAGFDLLMALDPYWFSTIFGVYFFAGSVVSFFASLILVCYFLQREGLVKEISTEHFHDMGKLMFAFTVFWAYIGFSQFMLMWYGNMPEETEWYIRRTHGGWLGVSAWLILGHFFIPFFLLMSRYPKRHTNLLALGAGWVLVMHYIDMWWLVMPEKGGVPFPFLDLGIFLLLGGVWLKQTIGNLSGKSLIPERDPRLGESLRFENF